MAALLALLLGPELAPAGPGVAPAPRVAQAGGWRPQFRHRPHRWSTPAARRPASGGAAEAGARAPAPPAAPGPPPPAAPGHPVLLAAGDIASCSSSDDEATAALLDGLAGTVVTLGDNAYDRGTPSEFSRCYGPSWGRHRSRTRPAPGNHDYGTPGAAGYFGYFGASAGEQGKGYYSYDLGPWHVVALNSNCWAVGGCGPGSPQERWLRADLAAHPARCTLAYWHHPRFSSGRHGSSTATAGLWQALHDAGADVVLAGHDHSYERFAPLDPSGKVDPAGGLRQFVVGTGGASHYGFGAVVAGSEARNSDAFGVLALSLGPAGYEWRFVAVPPGSYSDAGSDSCH